MNQPTTDENRARLDAVDAAAWKATAAVKAVQDAARDMIGQLTTLRLGRTIPEDVGMVLRKYTAIQDAMAAADQPVAAVLAELSTHHDDEVPL